MGDIEKPGYPPILGLFDIPDLHEALELLARGLVILRNGGFTGTLNLPGAAIIVVNGAHWSSETIVTE